MPLAVDAFLYLHGTGSNFYGSSLLAGLLPALMGWGAAVLAVNTRGHDAVSTAATNSGRRWQGAAFEIVDECRYDMAAWLEWLAGRGYGRIAVLGHSLGAVKAVYSLAHEMPAHVRCLVAISPPRLSHELFSASSQAAEFLWDYELAESRVREGRPQELLQVRFPLPYLVTAEGYLDKYGPQERYDILKYVDRVGCPMLFTFGSLELAHAVAFRGLPELLEARIGAQQRPRIAIVAGADHMYAGTHSELAAAIERWLRQMPE